MAGTEFQTSIEARPSQKPPDAARRLGALPAQTPPTYEVDAVGGADDEVEVRERLASTC